MLRRAWIAPRLDMEQIIRTAMFFRGYAYPVGYAEASKEIDNIPEIKFTLLALLNNC